MLIDEMNKAPGNVPGFFIGDNRTHECPLLAESGQSDRTRLSPLLE
jgi:hypothetical protein